MGDLRDLPRYVPEQIALYQTDHLLTHDVCPFDPVAAAATLQPSADVLAIDIGGDKIRGAVYSTGEGTFTKGTERFLQSKGGTGYLAFLESLAAEATSRNLRVGISCATKMEGSTISRTVNLSRFLEEFRTRYGADFRNLFTGSLSVTNDTIAGLCGSTMHLLRQGVASTDVAFIICASGLGGSVLTDGTATHVEVAHVPIIDSLNPLRQDLPCGVEGKTYVCVERVTAARAGIEDLYLKRTGLAWDGTTLGRLFEEGDPLATMLYRSSALALAHATAGLTERFSFHQSSRSVVVFHGGNLEVARYRRQLCTDLDRLPGFQSTVVFSRDLSENVCLDGAAVLAMYRGAHRDDSETSQPAR